MLNPGCKKNRSIALRGGSALHWPLRQGNSRSSLFRASYIALAVCIITFLPGCSGEQAPVPTVNPDAHVTTTIRIEVANPYIDDVKVTSTWQLGNIKCAPVVGIEGYLDTPFIPVDEQVTKNGSDFTSNILLDRFKAGKCKWFLAAGGILFMHGGSVYTAYAIQPGQELAKHVQSITCLPSAIGGGICELTGQLNAKERETKGKFNATVEYLP